MKRTRREFLQTGAAALGGSCLGVDTTARADDREAGIHCLDYGRSFI